MLFRSAWRCGAAAFAAHGHRRRRAEVRAALGAPLTRFARRALITLQDPIRKNEMPKTFIEKRLPELRVRGRAERHG